LSGACAKQHRCVRRACALPDAYRLTIDDDDGVGSRAVVRVALAAASDLGLLCQCATFDLLHDDSLDVVLNVFDGVLDSAHPDDDDGVGARRVVRAAALAAACNLSLLCQHATFDLLHDVPSMMMVLN
jgi:hypothetical protein